MWLLRARSRRQRAAGEIQAGLAAALGSKALPTAWFDAIADFEESIPVLQRQVNADRAEAAWMAKQK